MPLALTDETLIIISSVISSACLACSVYCCWRRKQQKRYQQVQELLIAGDLLIETTTETTWSNAIRNLDLAAAKNCYEDPEFKPNLNSINPITGLAPLHDALTVNGDSIDRAQVVKHLLENNADPNIPTSIGESPLKLAIKSKSLQAKPLEQFGIIHSLLKENADVSSGDEKKSLILTAEENNVAQEVIDLLKR